MIADHEQSKWRFLQDVPAGDAQHPLIQQLAKALRVVALGDDLRFAKLALAVARDCIAYKLDTDRTGGEDIAGLTREPTPHDAIDALMRGVDDCDAKARLFVALCLAGGLGAEMVPHWRGAHLAHVSGQVSIGGKWMHAETTLQRARLGDWPSEVPREKDGKLLT